MTRLLPGLGAVAIEYMRVVPARVAELEAQGWYVGGAATYADGQITVLMVRYLTAADVAKAKEIA